MKEMSGVQITMAFWKSIMSTIPDFFEVMERFKNYSYYYDTVMRDMPYLFVKSSVALNLS